MKIAGGENQIAQSASPKITPVNKIYAATVVAANMVAFAEKTLGWMLEARRARRRADKCYEERESFSPSELRFARVPHKDKQRELLTGPSKRVILNCTRQWGKSWMAAVALLFHAVHHPNSLSIVAGPTLRQSAKGPAAPKRIRNLGNSTAAGAPSCANLSEVPNSSKRSRTSPRAWV